MRNTVLSLVLVPILSVAFAADGVDTVAPAVVAADPPDPVVLDPVVDDLVASPDVDELSLSNAVIVASAAARAAEEVRVAAAAAERAELMKERAAAEAKAEIALARRRISTRTFHLAHASAEDVAAKLNSTWSGDFGVVWKINRMAIAFPESNSVFMSIPDMRSIDIRIKISVYSKDSAVISPFWG